MLSLSSKLEINIMLLNGVMKLKNPPLHPHGTEWHFRALAKPGYKSQVAEEGGDRVRIGKRKVKGFKDTNL